MNNQTRIEKMQHLLQSLNPSQLEIVDDSHQHIGHPGAKSGAGHFTVKIACSDFEGKSMVACHQLIYRALDEMIGPDIHALSIKIIKS